MIGLFKRPATPAAPDTAALGRTTLALRMPSGALVPAACTGVVAGKGGATRRIDHPGRLLAGEHEQAFCFHGGPYSVELTPFAAAPELGLQLTFAVDAPDPRVPQQRFDLFLASEAGTVVTLADLGAAFEATLQRELAQGNLELAPCTSIDEWHAFRAGLNELLYQRFGVTVDDCVPVDLGERVDYAAMLLARGAVSAQLAPAASEELAPSLTDAQALRRLFLELPGVTSAIRLLTLPTAMFGQQQQLLARLDCVGLQFDTMPALELAAPGRRRDAASQAACAAHSRAGVVALDEAWSLLARFAGPDQAGLFDDADRIVANLELHAAARRDPA